MTTPSQEYINAYTDIVIHYSETDPIFAEYLLSELPDVLQKQMGVIHNKSMKQIVKQGKQNWLHKGTSTIQEQRKPVNYNQFVDAVKTLATTYTDSIPNSVPQNIYRANRFIRMLRILKRQMKQANLESEIKHLQQKINQIKNKNQKILKKKQ